MTILGLAGITFGCGALGGFVNCLRVGEQNLWPRRNADGIWQPGWLGNIFLSGIAAALIWALYGPFALYDLFGELPFVAHIALAQLATSFVVGMAGSRILTLEVQKFILKNQRDAAEEAKATMTEVAEELLNDDPHP